jgi:hypothetical protein
VTIEDLTVKAKMRNHYPLADDGAGH